MEEHYDVVIVGAGASGLICALECAQAGLRCIVLEKDMQPARKILASGNGRCNVTNRHVSPAYYYTDPVLIESTFSHFSFQRCWDYFTKLGVLLTEEAQGRVFPASGKSTAIADALKIALKEAGADLRCGQEVVRIRKAQNQFTLTTRQQEIFHVPHVVLACGSCAYPQLTGTQAGYQLAQSLGHHIVPPQPVLSGVCLKEHALTRLSGVKCHVRTTLKTMPNTCGEGELIFTNYGINGPAVLTISHAIVCALQKGPVTLEINFLPQLPNPHDFFSKRFAQFSERKPKEFLTGLLHESITNLLIDFKGIRKNAPIRVQDLPRLVETLTAWPVTVTAMRPWQEAMVAAGGVKVSEINYNTFESRLCPGLFITGELLDVDGKSGGFNLHFAWASGYVAAQCIKEK